MDMIKDGDFDLTELHDEEGNVEEVAVKDIRVCILSHIVPFPNIGDREVSMFIYYFPFLNRDGGQVIAFYPLMEGGKKYRDFPTKELSARAFRQVIRKTKDRNPELEVIWDGQINRDMNYLVRRF